MSKNVLNIVRHLAHRLHTAYPNATQRHQIAWWLLEKVLHKSKTYLLTHDSEISPLENKELHDLVHAHITQHKPLQYLLGSVPFCSVDIDVQPPTLIPRSETEAWCAQLIEQLAPLKKMPLTILDMCTGSGCIAIALAHALPNAHIYAVDIAHEALALARHNAHKNNVGNITFLHSDLFANIHRSIQFDLIISNPPYITAHEWHELDPSVKNWEDVRALVANEDGLHIINTIIKNAPSFLKPDSPLIAHEIAQLWIEIGYNQGQIVAKNMLNHGFAHATINKDIVGHDRVVTGHLFTISTPAPVAQKQLG